MAIKQLTVFVQNKKGTVVSVTDILSKNNINMRALSIAETEDFGILRLIVNDENAAEKVLLELPAGLVDENENPLDAALRELQEEIKYSSAKITYLGCYYSSPGFTNELVHLYLAEDLFKSSLNEDEDEFIELSRYNIKQIKRLLTSNTITDMKTALGLMMYLNSKNDQSN